MHRSTDAENEYHVDTQIGPGGWRRAVIGFAVGLVAGIAVAALLPRPDEDDVSA